MKVRRKYNPHGWRKPWPTSIGRSFPASIDRAAAGGTSFKADYDGNQNPHRIKIPGPKQAPEPPMVLVNGKLRRKREKETGSGDS